MPPRVLLLLGALLAAAQLGTAQLPLMWTPSSNPPLGSAILWSGAFADANTAVFVGTMSSLTSATILRSTDGGQTFSNAPSPKLNLKGVAAVPGSTTTAWAVGPVDSSNYKAVLLKTTDAGVSWTRQTTTYTLPNQRNLNCIAMVDANVFYTAGSGGGIWRTKDGGVTWEDASFAGTNWEIYSIVAWGTAASHRVLVSTPLGLMMLSTDSGRTYTTLTPLAPLGTGAPFFGIKLVPGSTTALVASGTTGTLGLLLKSTDGGVTWQYQTFPGTSICYDVYFWTPLRGIVACDMPAYAATLHTFDGGSTWTTTPLLGNFRIRSLAVRGNRMAVGMTSASQWLYWACAPILNCTTYDATCACTACSAGGPADGGSQCCPGITQCTAYDTSCACKACAAGYGGQRCAQVPAASCAAPVSNAMPAEGAALQVDDGGGSSCRVNFKRDVQCRGLSGGWGDVFLGTYRDGESDLLRHTFRGGDVRPGCPNGTKALVTFTCDTSQIVIQGSSPAKAECAVWLSIKDLYACSD